MPVAVATPTILRKDLLVYSAPDRNEVQLRFSLDAPSLVTCDIFDLQGKKKGSLSRLLDAGAQAFTFIPGAQGVFLVRVTTATSIHTAKFISYGSSEVPQLRYDGFSESLHSPVSTNSQSASKAPGSYYEYGQLLIHQNDLLRINCYSGTKVQTIYDYASGDKNYTLRFTDRYHQFQLYNIVASKPSFVDVMYAVTDASNRGVDDLNKLDFVVQEDGANISASESFRHVRRMNQVPFQIKTILRWAIHQPISMALSLLPCHAGTISLHLTNSPRDRLLFLPMATTPRAHPLCRLCLTPGVPSGCIWWV